jgi:UDP-N-acetylmuramoyl-tripeptide--D-alanyl-D-alanine ligase
MPLTPPPRTPALTLSQAAAWLDGRLLGDDRTLTGVGSDSRSLRPGQLFVALTGPHHDGHGFAPQAAAAGAAALLVSRPLESPLPQLLVPDTRIALGRLAGAWRASLPGRVVAITGSNGKTTTKEMLAAALTALAPTHATRGNLNNDIGVPLTLLAATDQAFLVIEMGANHPGEIAALTALARPDVALITNAGRAHLEGFGSLEGVARAKGEIIAGLGPDGVFVVNADDPWAPLWQQLAGPRRILSFGFGDSAAVRPGAGTVTTTLDPDGFHCHCPVRTPRGNLDLQLALAGRHNLANALATLAVAEALGLDLEPVGRALAGLRPIPGRLDPRPGPRGARLIDDSYNANPDSVTAALAVLADLPGRRWLVLGDLAELGPGAAALHRTLGEQARAAGIQRLWAQGALCAGAVAGFGAGARQFPDREALTAALQAELGAQDVVLIKGSRSAGMEQVVRALTGAGGN